jgi:hypothetical protein
MVANASHDLRGRNLRRHLIGDRTMFGENGNAGTHRFRVPDPDLDTAYEAAHEEARNLLARIEELLCDLPAPGSEDCPIDWTHVGSVNEVNRLLSEVVAFLASTKI